MILTDDLFLQYGGMTGTSTALSRQIAYQIAEDQVRDFLGYPLSPETFTGQYPSFLLGGNIELGYSKVRDIHSARLVHYDPLLSTRDVFKHTFLIDNRIGVIDTHLLHYYKSIHGLELQVVYEAGLDSGTFVTSQAGMMGLAAAAQIVLNELVTPGLQEGRVGIQEFTNMKYTEKRFPLNASIFGSSAAANYVRKLLDRSRVSRVGRV